jgi:hypothetical protein
MAIDPRKRQKQLAKHRAKRKAKAKTSSNKSSAYGSSMLGRAMATLEMEMAMRGPVDECYAADNIFSGGMGSVIVSRQSGAGHIAAGVYLIDAYCLGVKDAFARLCTYGDFRRLLDESNETMRMRRVEPAYARKLIVDAVAYARDLGLEPHPDFKYASRLLEDIDASACTTEFSFGLNGKPFFIAGPYDTPVRIRQITAAMASKRNPDEYNLMIPLPPDAELFYGGDEDDDFEDEDEDDDGDDDERN